MTVGLSRTAILGDFGGYFFGNLRDKASIIISSCVLDVSSADREGIQPVHDGYPVGPRPVSWSHWSTGHSLPPR